MNNEKKFSTVLMLLDKLHDNILLLLVIAD